jgi:uncharacterized low-complexity protein
MLGSAFSRVREASKSHETLPFMNDDSLLEARQILHHHLNLVRTERSCLADLLLSVGDFEHRGLHRVLGHAGIFDYLHRDLGMSRGMAHYRMVASRLLRRFPEVEKPVRDGRLCLTTIVEVARVMTEENRSDVLPRFFGLSRKEARLVAVEVAPSAVVPRRTVISTVAAPAVANPQGALGSRSSTVELEVPQPVRGLPLDEASRATVDPLNASESRMHVTVSRAFLALLKKAKAGQAHVQPGATDEQVLTAALEALIEKQAKRKACVPAKVKRDVLKRDEGKCQWPTHDGGICGATARAEIDHVVPRGMGGPSTVENCRILCRPHNLEAARRAYGDAHMDLFTRGRSPRGLPMAKEEVAAYGGIRRPPRLRGLRPPSQGGHNPIARTPAAGVGFPPCSGRKPSRSGFSACGSRSSSSLAPASSSSTTRGRPWACRSAGGRGTTSDPCTWG